MIILLTFFVCCFLVCLFLIRYRRSTSKFVKCFICGTLFCALIASSMVDAETNEFIEHTFFKGNSPIHHYFQTARNQTTFNSPPKDLLTFIHIPRTAGDSMAMHSFFVPYTLRFSPLWRHSRGFLLHESAFKRHKANGALVSKANGRFSKRIDVVRGYIDYYDVLDLHELVGTRRLRTFTFLRDPVERFLSFLSFTNTDVEHAMTLLESFEGFHLNEDHRDRHANITAYDEQFYLADFLFDGIAHQLGDTLFRSKARIRDLDLRQRVTTDETIVRRAQLTLDRCDYVGFYEDLAYDFWQLRTTLFGDINIPLHFPWLFWLGAWIATPRTRVRKFAEQQSHEMLARIEKFVHLDRQVYEHARQKYRPNMQLYDSYIQFCLAYSPIVLCILAFLVVLLVWQCKFRKNNTIRQQ